MVGKAMKQSSVLGSGILVCGTFDKPGSSVILLLIAQPRCCAI